jgi:hypothetical protein
VSKCAYVEMVNAGHGCVLEFPCENEAVHGLFCEEHKCFDYDPEDLGEK